MPWPARQRWMARHGQPIIGGLPAKPRPVDMTATEHLLAHTATKVEAARVRAERIRAGGLALYEAGATIAEVAQVVGEPASVTYRALVDHVTPERRARAVDVRAATAGRIRRAAERRATVLAGAAPLWEAGWTLRRIGFRLGVSRGMVRRVLADAGLRVTP